MSEAVYYEDDTVRVTDLEAVFGANSRFALSNIAIASAAKSPNAATGIGLLVVGLVFAAFWILAGADDLFCLMFPAALAILGILVWAMGGSLWWVHVETTQGKKKKMLSTDKERAETIVNAVNQAIKERKS